MSREYDAFIAYGFRVPDNEAGLHVQKLANTYKNERPDTGDVFGELICLDEWAVQGYVVYCHASERSFLLPNTVEVIQLPSCVGQNVDSYDEAIHVFCEAVGIAYRKPSWIFGGRCVVKGEAQ